MLVLYDLPRFLFACLSDFRRVLLDKDVIRLVSFLMRIACSLSNDSEEYVSIRFRIKKECEICNCLQMESSNSSCSLCRRMALGFMAIIQCEKNKKCNKQCNMKIQNKNRTNERTNRDTKKVRRPH